jgi:hypothetical protein
MKNVTALTAEHVTSLGISGQDMPLFTVRAGVPVNEALQAVSYLVSVASGAVQDLAMGAEDTAQPSALYATHAVLELAQGLVQAIDGGLKAG